MVSLVISVAVPVIAAILVNTLIFLQQSSPASSDGSQQHRPAASPLLPPGVVVGVVWVVILAGLGAAFWALDTASARRSGTGVVVAAKVALVALVLYCIAYPFITGMDGMCGCMSDPRSRVTRRRVLVSNYAALLLSVIVVCLVIAAQTGARSTALVLPVLVWTAYVGFTDAWGVDV
jgi:tryptophan-rich sensory protein